jgi:hypothetical protein
MRTNSLLVLLAFFLFLPLQRLAAAEQAEKEETIQQRLDDLQQELDQLRKEHEAEIRELETKLESQEKRSADEGAPYRAQPVGNWGIMNPSICSRTTRRTTTETGFASRRWSLPFKAISTRVSAQM